MIDRRYLSQKQRAEMFLAQKGLCFCCGCKLQPSRYHADHRQALEHGGDNSLDNIKLLCTDCHKDKTRKDHQARAKVERLAAGGRQRKGPPMAGSRASGIKKCMDGSVVRR